jgi:hypothetical protein
MAGDAFEPGFGDAVMDPANWGPATAMMHAMDRDGVDISDSASVDAWIAQQNAGVFTGNAGGFAAPEADPFTWDGVDLKEAFGIPDAVAPAGCRMMKNSRRWRSVRRSWPACVAWPATSAGRRCAPPPWTRFSSS